MRNFFVFCALLSFIMVIWGCHSKKEVRQVNEVLANSVEKQEDALEVSDVSPASQDDQKLFTESVNGFGIDFYSKLDVKENIVFSPFSLHSALAMTSYGARGETLDEMQKVLHLGSDRDKAAVLHSKMGLKLRYDGQEEDSRLNIANRVWVDEGLELVEGFVSMLDKNYKSGIEQVDFVHKSKDVVDIINQWVELNTHKKISKLVGQDDVDSTTRMVLVNALYFKGKWQYPFDANETREQDFYLNESETKKVSMMTTSGRFKIYHGDKYSSIIMPYMGDKYEMIIILPKSRTGLQELMGSFGTKDIEQVKSEATRKKMDLSLPKFKIEQEIRAKDILSSMGMRKAFEGADFSGISNSELVISDVIHKAIIEVDEEGTEAAAATAVVMMEMAAVLDKEHFIVDHPFGYALVHSESGTVLFMGQYVK